VQCGALVDLAQALGISTWTGAGSMHASTWMRGTSFCTWTGVTCSGGTVTELSLTGGGVAAWPASVGNLQALQRLYYEPMSSSGSPGALPSGISGWSSLLSLSITCSRAPNCFNGSLSALSSLPALQSLSLRSMTAVSSPSAWSLPNLTSMQLDSLSALTGTVPVPPSLLLLSVKSAGFTALPGTLPASLRSIEVTSTPLAGTFPDVSSLTALTSIAITGTQLSGTIPSASCASLNPL
jgi:hypothetical protein